MTTMQAYALIAKMRCPEGDKVALRQQVADGNPSALFSLAALQTKRDRENRARRARHAAYTDLGMVRVRGALGGVYYE